MSSNLVIVGCSRRKRATSGPLPALELYQGGCVPQLRARLATAPSRRWHRQVWILSARHGLVAAATPLAGYDQPLTLPRARQLQPSVQATLATCLVSPAHNPAELLVVLEPLYLVALAGVLADPARPRVHWLPDPAADWPAASAVLDHWGWP